MKGKNKKGKSILVLILLLVIIAAVSVCAYIACQHVGQGQVSTIEQEQEANDANQATNGDSSDASQDTTNQDTSSQGEVAKEEVTDSAQAESETSDETLNEATKEEKDDASIDSKDEANSEDVTDTKKEGFFDKNKIKLGLDLQGGVDIVYEAQIEDDLSDEELLVAMEGAQKLIQTRLDSKGYTEAEVSIEGSKRLRVDIPGVDDPQKAIDEIGAAGMLYFYDETFLTAGPEAKPILTGKNVASARASQNTQTGEYYVSIQLDDEGTKIFDEFTANNIGKTIYIFLDNTLLSMATIQTHITDGSGAISGNFTLEGVKSLADGINAGALPFTLKAIGSESVGATLGAKALSSSILAGILGLIVIMVFIAVAYRLCGVAADIALVLYVGIVILVLTIMNATLTLPGIAGILLSIGMAVDANVIIFARIREELEVGKSVALSVNSGFAKAFKAILDGNITTLIAAVVLYIFGTGLIKSFATTLIIGIVVSMFTALVITRMILKAFIGMDIKKPSYYAKLKKHGKEA